VSRIPQSMELWWPTTDGAVEAAYWYEELPPPINVAIRYRGLVCFGETDWDQGSSEDEPYVIMTTVSATGATNTVRSRIYEDVDAGESCPDEVEIYRGPAHGVNLGVVLMEHDEGDPNKYRDVVESGVRTAAGGIAAGVTAVGGPLAGAAVTAVLQKFAPDIAKAVNDLLDFGDDKIDADTLVLDTGRLTDTAKAGWLDSHGVSYKIETKLLSGEGASYKAHFDVVQV
ncbi:hypothetical protein P3X83_21690, partial [Spongiactinospora sp. TRM90649]|nr:hypothetical protein [Spongiactinospora sp. TRM90649]